MERERERERERKRERERETHYFTLLWVVCNREAYLYYSLLGRPHLHC